MTIARAHLIDPSLTRWYHCVTRCVRRAYLLGNEEHNRKEWIESRLEELANCFAVAVGGFSVMNNYWVASLPRAKRSCRRSPNACTCDTWSISPGVLPDERILSYGSDQSRHPRSSSLTQHETVLVPQSSRHRPRPKVWAR